jgi:peptidoglycan/xylan/chitin deacetylase (PgdA/CDA1 family)
MRRDRIYWAVRHRLEGLIVSVATTEPVAALTFDDGPHPVFTPQVLELLARHGARATFFMIGRQARRYPELVREVAVAGHAIGNHTWDHRSLTGLSGRERRHQLRAGAQALAPYGASLLRPPYGHFHRRARFDAWLCGYRHVIAWNLVVYDWLDHDPAWMRDRILHHIQPGSIILLHDALATTLDPAYSDRGPMLAALKAALTALAGRYRFVTVSELLRQGRPQLRIWERLPDPAFMARLQAVDSSP